MLICASNTIKSNALYHITPIVSTHTFPALQRRRVRSEQVENKRDRTKECVNPVMMLKMNALGAIERSPC